MSDSQYDPYEMPVAQATRRGDLAPAIPSTPMEMLGAAVSNGMDVQALEKLMDLQERWEGNIARKAYAKAFAKFQSEVPDIKKLKQAHNYKYAPLSDIAHAIRECLQANGLSYRFQIEEQGDDGIRVTCIVSHVDGHEEATTMVGNSDDSSGNMTALQRRASTVTYLQRYTLIGALGLTTADEDMDARLGIEQATITEEQAVALEERRKNCNMNEEKYLSYLGVESLSKLPATQLAKAEQALADREKKLASAAKARAAKAAKS